MGNRQEYRMTPLKYITTDKIQEYLQRCLKVTSYKITEKPDSFMKWNIQSFEAVTN